MSICIQIKFRPPPKKKNWIDAPGLALAGLAQQQDGTYCKFCILFVPQVGVGTNHQRSGRLVVEKYNRWKDALEDFAKHQATANRLPRGVDPYGTGGTRPPQYLDWGDIITNVPPIFLE